MRGRCLLVRDGWWGSEGWSGLGPDADLTGAGWRGNVDLVAPSGAGLVWSGSVRCVSDV